MVYTAITVKPYNLKSGGDTMVIEKVTLPVARKIAGMTQKDLAAAIHVSENTIIKWEKGRGEPSVSKAIAIGEAVGIPYDNIVFLPRNTV